MKNITATGFIYDVNGVEKMPIIVNGVLDCRTPSVENQTHGVWQIEGKNAVIDGVERPLTSLPDDTRHKALYMLSENFKTA